MKTLLSNSGVITSSAPRLVVLPVTCWKIRNEGKFEAMPPIQHSDSTSLKNSDINIDFQEAAALTKAQKPKIASFQVAVPKS